MCESWFICVGCGRKYCQADVEGPYCYSCIVKGLPDCRNPLEYFTFKFYQSSFFKRR